MRINADSGSSYYTEQVQGLASAASASLIASLDSSAFAGHVATGGAPAGMYSTGEVKITGWDSPHSTYLGYLFATQSMTTGGLANQGGGSYVTAGPYLSVRLFPAAGNFVADSVFTLDGWD